ncbi:hypothetical protein CYMTET_47375 [Cymbomonas tetramitiformis]|uniref:Uncharacterized protein n=1 Tax=Cymbomonas tetramitiformis TaxID=36881 RepID=A0AAE0EW87_9CHLO|nr:hypothetical protein CYMTET_47375 [Cymbomonas tetramitiformis]
MHGFSEGRYPIISWMDFDEDEIVHLWDIDSPEEENGIPAKMFDSVVANVKGIMASRAESFAGTSAASTSAAVAAE